MTTKRKKKLQKKDSRKAIRDRVNAAQKRLVSGSIIPNAANLRIMDMGIHLGPIHSSKIYNSKDRLVHAQLGDRDVIVVRKNPQQNPQVPDNLSIAINLSDGNAYDPVALTDFLRSVSEQENGLISELILVTPDQVDATELLDQLINDFNEEILDQTVGTFSYQSVFSTQINDFPNTTTSTFAVVQGDPLRVVMSEAELREMLGKEGDEKSSPAFLHLVKQLRDYEGLFNDQLGPDLANSRYQGISQLNQDVDTKLQSLRAAAIAYRDKHIGRFADKDKKQAAQRLVDQLAAPGLDQRVKAELRRIFVDRLDAIDVTNAALVTKLGGGAKGEIEVKTFTLPDGTTLDAAVKWDTENSTDPAIDAGIPKNDPQESKRGVLSYRIDQLIGLDAVPKTFFVKNSSHQLGQAIEFVKGMEGQKMVETERIKMDRALFDLSDYAVDVAYYDTDTGEAVKINPQVIDLDYTNPVIQKSLSDLQTLDTIIGAADRHAGNFLYTFSKTNATEADLVGVKGIDNDDTFGKDWKNWDKGASTFVQKQQSKTPGVPPVIAIETAINVLKTEEGAFKAEVAKYMDAEEVQASAQRLQNVKAAITQRVKDKQIAATQPVGADRTDELSRLSGEPIAPVDILTWGANTFQMHQDNNSYLGAILTRKLNRGVVPPIFP